MSGLGGDKPNERGSGTVSMGSGSQKGFRART